ncbi:MAG TPA: hypothetical protein V6C76_04705 [Drouetiella sp.]
MYAYLIIAVELAILYSVFWYVFIREPRPYTVKGDLWGSYSQSQYNAIDDYESQIDLEWLESNRNALENIYSGHQTNQSHLSHLPMKPIENTKQYGWVVREQESEAGAVAKLFGKFRNSVEVLSVRVP